jgi:sigma-E factor negative regulatory protein RseB
MSRVVAVCLASCALATPVAAQQGASEALQWLQRVSTVAQKLSYSGIFVYQSGNRGETSRITHLAENSGETEHLEVLDGSPREVIRQNDEVKCYLPESRLLIIAHRSSRRTFPALLPGTMAGLTEHYVVRKGPAGRVAGIDSQSIVIEPKDDNRYGHELWFDPLSGLLLKAGLIGSKGELLETVAFTEVKIGGPIDRDALKSRLEASSGGWHVYNVRSADVRSDDGLWLFKNNLPGFRRLSWLKQQMRPDVPEATQVIFSDGLAAVSVFIEPNGGQEKPADDAFSMGAISVYRRQVADFRLVVLGDVPPAALRRFADGIEPRKK